MVLRWTPKFNRHFYGCSRWPDCDAAHGAHPDGRPLGVPANKETKRARIAAHDMFDTLWKGERPLMHRKQAYARLCKALGIQGKDCHIGSFDIETCQRTVKAVEEILGGDDGKAD